MARLISTGLGRPIDYYAEYLDVPRSSDRKYLDSFRDFLRVKYRDQQFDLIVAVQNAAINVLSRYRDELFPNAPVVFLAQDSAVERLRNSTGYLGEPDLASTVALARKLQPDTRQVFVITGASTPDRFYEKLTRAQLQVFDPALTITYLAGLTAPRLEQTVATLPEHSIVYYVLVYKDAAGENFNPVDYVDRIAGLANRPTYSWTESTMNHGIVGGTLRSQRAQIEALAGLVVRVLRGEPADSIPLTELKVGQNEVDWRQLRRWNISVADVPPGTRVLFRDADLWHEYKYTIVGAAILLVVQTLLIALQEVERSRIARDLHDDVTQVLSLLVCDLRLAGSSNDPTKSIQELVDKAQDITTSVRNLSHQLHPAHLRIVGLVASLESLQRDYSKAGLAISISHSAVPPKLPVAVALSLYRIAQEGLQNAIKHGAAHAISVNLKGGVDGLVLSIEDDGAGFQTDGPSKKGLGLVSMRERAESLGGTLKINSAPGHGTCLEVRVPGFTQANAESAKGTSAAG